MEKLTSKQCGCKVRYVYSFLTIIRLIQRKNKDAMYDKHTKGER